MLTLLLVVVAIIIASWLYQTFKDKGPSESDREVAELRALYERVVGDQGIDGTGVQNLVAELLRVLDIPLVAPMRRALSELLSAEEITLAKPDFEKLDLAQRLELKKKLKVWEIKLHGSKRSLEDSLTGIFYSLMEQLPRAAEPSPFTIPLIYALPNARSWISSLYLTISDPDLEAHYEELRHRMYYNVCAASDIDPRTDTKRKFKHAKDSTLPLDQVNDVYLRGTAFHSLMSAPVPLRLSHEDRFGHMHIVGGTGAGKTTLIENLILHDLTSDDPPSLVLIDPHGDLIGKLLRLDIPLGDRLIYVNPRDIEHPPALNVFALNKERMEDYDPATREQVQAGVIQTFDYLFTGLVGADLTAKQGVFFRYLARFMLALPDAIGRNATILDMMKLMEEPPRGSPLLLPEPYRSVVASLPEIQRDFFERDFMSKTFAQTKEQIRYRLQAIIENPTLARLFTSEETKIDLFDDLNRGSIVVVDTAKDFLKGGSATFGRLFISLVLQAVLERAAIPANKRKDTFLIVDEAASYFDSNIDDLLTEARKYRCGLVLAHQYLDQATGQLRASLAANTAIKFAAGLSAGDARAMAPEMRSTPDFILNQERLHFAAYIRNTTPQAVSIPVHPGLFDGLPKLSDEAYADRIARNQERVSSISDESDDDEADEAALAAAVVLSIARTRVSPAKDEDISTEW